MSLSSSIGCLLMLIACLVFPGTAARHWVEGQHCSWPATPDNSSMRDAIETAWNARNLQEFAAVRQFRSNSTVRIREASRFRGPMHPAFPSLDGPRARSREFRTSQAPEQTVLICYSSRLCGVPQPAASTQWRTDMCELKLAAHNGRPRGSPRGRFPG